MKDLGSIDVTQAALTLATCFRIVRRDGQMFTFTDHDQDLIVDGETYVAATGYTRTANVQNGDLAVDDVSVEGVLDATTITEHEMRAGVWDYAEARMFAVDWSNVGAGKIRMKRGRLGEVSCDDAGRFTTELRGLAQYLSQQIGETYTPECRAILGDSRCKVDLAPWTFAGSVTSVTSQDTIVTDFSNADAFFNNGTVTFTSGLNNGVTREVLSYSGGGFWLFQSLPYPIAVGDTLSATAGCDQTRQTCINRFNNILNYRGEPFVPGDDWFWSNAGEFNT